VKVRDEVCTRELALAVLVMLMCWVGMAISVAGLAKLPRCQYGDPRCYFFVQVCDNKLFETAQQQSCVYVAKQRKTESSNEYGLEQVSVPLLASTMGVLPGIALVIAMIIRNERCLFSMLEIGKMFIAFNIILLVVSCMHIDRITWDCRWWGEQHHPDGPKCEKAYGQYVIGTTFIFITEFLLLVGGIAYTEVERKRVNDKRAWFSDGGDSGPSDAVQMNTRVQGNQQTPSMGPP